MKVNRPNSQTYCCIIITILYSIHLLDTLTMASHRCLFRRTAENRTEAFINGRRAGKLCENASIVCSCEILTSYFDSHMN